MPTHFSDQVRFRRNLSKIGSEIDETEFRLIQSMNRESHADYKDSWGYSYREAMRSQDAVADLEQCPRDVTALSITGKTRGLSHLNEFHSLATVVADGASQEMVDALASLPSLKECRLWKSSATSFHGLGKLRQLRRLWMRDNTKCTEVNSLASLTQITHLALIHFPKVHSYSSLGKLTQLCALAIEGAWGAPVRIDS